MYRKLISSRLKKLESALLEIANGEDDLSQRLDETPQDEIALVSKAFNTFMSNMESSLKKIGDQVTQLTNTTDTMTSISEKSQIGVSSIQDETNQISQTMEQVTNTAGIVTETARQGKARQGKPMNNLPKLKFKAQTVNQPFKQT